MRYALSKPSGYSGFPTPGIRKKRVPLGGQAEVCAIGLNVHAI
jgi:hypothetical protein